MPFGLCNAPATFQAFINSILNEFLDEFCSAYLDDVLVYSETEEEHIVHCNKVLSKLCDAGLHLDIKKCEFHVTRVKYLGMILTAEGLQMDPDKVKAIQDWKDLRTVKDVQAFIGFANFYRQFIHKFTLIVRPLIDAIVATQPGQKLVFTDKAKSAFKRLKLAFNPLTMAWRHSSTCGLFLYEDEGGRAQLPHLQQRAHGHHPFIRRMETGALRY
jgi:hypothetical protein